MTLEQMSAKAFDSQKANDKVTPITRVVGLLEEMQVTLDQEMEDDKKIYGKMECWCHNNIYGLETAIADGTKKAQRFSSQVDQFQAKSNNFASSLRELGSTVDEDNRTLYEATQFRFSERKKFQNFEKMSINSIESLKSALVVLKPHEAENSLVPSSAFTQLASSFLQRMSVSLRSKSKSKDVYSDMGMQSDSESQLEAYMDNNPDTPEVKPIPAPQAVSETSSTEESVQPEVVAEPSPALQSVQPQDVAESSPMPQSVQGKFLEQKSVAIVKPAMPHQMENEGWSDSELTTIRKAIQAGTVYMQTTMGQSYTPAYEGGSFELQGRLKQMKLTMESDLEEAQKKELKAQQDYDKMRKAVLLKIQIAQMLEVKQKDAKTDSDNNLIWSKLDLGNTLAVLKKDTESYNRVTKECAEAKAAFEQRKIDRTDELTAVRETIDILTSDDARDAQNIAYTASEQKSASFLQLTSEEQHRQELHQKATAFLRNAAKRTGSSRLALFGTKDVPDKFGVLNVAIDKMVWSLKYEQKEEVKENDHCEKTLHENEMTGMKLKTDKEDMEEFLAQLDQKIKELTSAIADERKEVARMEKALKDAKDQRAEERAEYLEVSTNQKMTKRVLERASDRLNQYYGKAKIMENVEKYGLAQKSEQASAPSMFTTPVFTTPKPPYDATAPAPDQMEYKPHAGNVGVFALFKKLIKDIEKEIDDTYNEEKAAISEYMDFKKSTNDALYDSRKEIARQTRQKAKAEKAKFEVIADLANNADQLKDLADWDKANRDQCMFIMENFGMRQAKRQEEIESLQQAKQILTGAETAELTDGTSIQ